ncbi:MAG: ABC transporter permease subunit [Erysipelotrichaceae bacterium]
MKKQNLEVYDHVDKVFARKNLYLKDVALLQEAISESNGQEKKEKSLKLKELIRKKKSHPYNIRLEEYYAKEKTFITEVKNEINSLPMINQSNIKKIDELEKEYLVAEKEIKFYQSYIDLTYDAELKYKQAVVKKIQIPAIIEFACRNKKDLLDAQSNLTNIDLGKEEQRKKDLEVFKKRENDLLKKDIDLLKSQFKNKVISEKAFDEAKKRLIKAKNERVAVQALKSDRLFYNDVIRNKKHQLSVILKQKITTLRVNVDDVRREVVVEVDKQSPINCYLGILFPGLPQLLNKQYMKAALFSLATIFIYVISIPYALGFGNYRGKGIAGLLSLAKGGGRLDRSIIFMIEGILAILLILISVVLLIISFQESRKVEVKEIKGVRKNTWVESKGIISDGGIPYVICTPALILTLFIVIIPIATTILLSFTNMDPDHQAKFGWAMLANYKQIILGQGLAGSVFYRIFGWTIIWTIGATSLSIFIGFVLALLLNNERIKGTRFFRSIYLLPWAVPAFITILFFSILASPDGQLTKLLQPLFNSTVSIKNSAIMTKVVLICVQGWLGSSYVFLLATGVLQSINSELYEASGMDGATPMKQLFKITIPLVLFQTAPLLVGQYTFNFNNFSNIYLFNNGGPFNPHLYGNLAGETDILISYIYKLTIENEQQAIGAAITVMISLGLMFVAYLGLRKTETFRKEK